MNFPFTLEQLSSRLKIVDLLLLSLFKKRLDLSLEVEKRKSVETTKEKRAIYNPQREEERVQLARDWAAEHGINPLFAAAMLYGVIDESCKVQMVQREVRGTVGVEWVGSTSEEEWQKLLSENLLRLTEHWAKTYDEHYDTAFFATHSYLEHEQSILAQELEALPDRELLVDLGCATGRLTFQFADKFEKVVGYDISQHMIQKADEKLAISKLANISFKVADIQTCIPEESNSVSLVVMNLGTASDIRELPKVLKEVARILKPHGRFFFSFYNKEALLYQWKFIPWFPSVAAEVNFYRDCLDVHLENETLSVYAKSYTVDQVLELIKSGLAVSEIQTYPTISAILPNDLFENQPDVQRSVEDLDRHLMFANSGAYIIATGQKT